ncbi:MAG: hypothetical protein ABI852_05295 [Gemmatimonadaceae bacterium]
MWIRRSFFVLAIASVGCKAKEEAAPPPAVDPSAPEHVMAPDMSYVMNLPGRWTGLTRTDTLSTAERGTALPGAVNIVYIPRDTAIIPQTLVVIAVYESAAWAKVKAEGGPPPGDSIASGNGRVWVVALPQSNPFTPGSIDALKFDSLGLKPEEKTGIVTVSTKK